ncbi:MAG: hypothetical protein JWN01_267 [Patescibacteria group bacterium]|nr:hypothetical protein [Patescibacteria group bacterium]
MHMLPFFIINYAVTIGLAVLAWRVLPTTRTRVLFVATLVLLASYRLYNVPEGDVTDWLHHVPFYIGEVVFYFFLVAFGQHYIAKDAQATSSSAPARLGLPAVAAGGSWFDFLTNQGLHHIVTFPLYFLILAANRMNYMTMDERYQGVAKWLMWGVFFFIAVHIGEFLIESQNLAPVLKGYVEYLEFGWVYLASACLAVALLKLRKVSRV